MQPCGFGYHESYYVPQYSSSCREKHLVYKVAFAQTLKNRVESSNAKAMKIFRSLSFLVLTIVPFALATSTSESTSTASTLNPNYIVNAGKQFYFKLTQLNKVY